MHANYGVSYEAPPLSDGYLKEWCVFPLVDASALHLVSQGKGHVNQLPDMMLLNETVVT